MQITITLDENEVKILRKRAEKNMLELKEMIEDIVRRSCINFKGKSYEDVKFDDKLVGIFSRQRKGRKNK